MSASIVEARRIRRLHLVAPDASLHRRGVRLIEDAVRTASLPDAGPRVTVIRRFALGRFGAAISPQALALALERRINALARDAVHAADPTAPAAPAVWFRDALEAHTLLAAGLAERKACEEWFWPLAVPGAAPAQGRLQALREVILAVSRLPEARAALPPFVRALAARGLAPQVVECLHEGDIAPLLAAGAARAAPGLKANVASETTGREAPHPALAPSTPLAARAGFNPLDPRVRWLAALLTPADGSEHSIAATPPPRPRAGLLHDPGRATSLDRPSAAQAAAHRGAPAPPTANVSVAVRADARVLRPVHVEPTTAPADDRDTPRIEAPHATSQLPDMPRPCTHEPRGRDAAEERAPGSLAHAPLDQPAWPAGAPTAAGGLLFLLGVLERAGYPQWLEQAIGWEALAIERRVFARVCASLRLARNDPAWMLTVGTPDTGPLVDAVTRAWLATCRRWLRRHARLGIAGLVARPARLSLTPTHVDVDFPSSGASMAARCAGLDLDPGWVPWFGRVVSFHYGESVEPWT